MKKNIIASVAVGAVVLASAGSSVYFYSQSEQAKNNNPNIQTEKIVSSLKKTVELPNETPSVLTVVDTSKLKDKQIAAKAKNGDKILLFQKAKEVYIYRPSENKLISILNISTTSSSATSSDNKETSSTKQP